MKTLEDTGVEFPRVTITSGIPRFRAEAVAGKKPPRWRKLLREAVYWIDWPLRAYGMSELAKQASSYLFRKKWNLSRYLVMRSA